VDEIGARLAWRHDHQVHLGAPAEQDRRLVLAGPENALHARQPGEAADEGSGVGRLRQQVQVADRLAPPPERAGRLEAGYPRDVRQPGDEPSHDGFGGSQEHPPGARLERRDRGQDRRLGLLG